MSYVTDFILTVYRVIRFYMYVCICTCYSIFNTNSLFTALEMLQFLNQDWSVKYIIFHLLNVTTLDDNFNFFPVFMFLTFMIFIIDV